MTPLASLLGPDTEDDSPAVDARPSEAADDGSSGGWLRKALLGLGLLGAAAVVVNRRRETRTDEWRADSPDAATGPDATSADTETTDEGEAGAVETGSDSADTGESDSGGVSTTMAERSVEDAQEEPADPGEMTVDDDVVEEVADGDDGDEDEADAAGEETDAADRNDEDGGDATDAKDESGATDEEAADADRTNRG